MIVLRALWRLIDNRWPFAAWPHPCDDLENEIP